MKQQITYEERLARGVGSRAHQEGFLDEFPDPSMGKTSKKRKKIEEKKKDGE